MSEIAVENINVAAIMGTEGMTENMEKVKAAFEADQEVGPLMRAAQSIEDVYEIVKKFSTATLEQVKVILQKTVDYLYQDKAELSDETLDCVAGGWFLTDWWKQNKGDCIMLVSVIACVAVGTVVGACYGGVGGAIAGASTGAVVGGVIGCTVGAIVNAVTGTKSE